MELLPIRCTCDPRRFSRFANCNLFDLKMIGWTKDTKKRVQSVLSTARTSFYYGFIFVIIYLGMY